jgi:type I restriction enzyme S subunit
MANYVSGSALPRIILSDFKKMKIKLNDDKKIQEKVSNILVVYDDLIENNNKRIKLLEQMAENLYKEWFVRRRNPAWEYIRLSDFGYSLESGSRPKGGIDASLQDGYPSLGAEAIGRLGEFDFSSTKLVPEDFYKKMKRGIGKDKDILLYKDGAYIGKVTLFMDEFPYKDYSINEHVFLMRSNESLYQYYLYFTLALPQYFTQMQNLNRNAAQPGLTGKDIDTLKLYSPDEDTIRKFNSAIEPMMHNIFSLAKQNQILINQRDLLLPRLMSGKLEV